MSDDLSIPNPSYRGNRAGRYGASAPRRRPGMDPDTKRLLMFAGGVGGVLVLLIAASVLTNRHSGQIPVVAADPSPIRVKPENPGGMKIDAAENDVFSGSMDTGNARLAPAAETPELKALHAAETAGVHPAPAPVAAAPVPPPVPNPSADAHALPPAAPSVPPPPAPQVRPAERSALVKPPAPPAHDAAAASKTAAGPAADAKTASPRHVLVQLAAMDSDAQAKAEWERQRARYGDLLDGRQLIISQVDSHGHTYWRVRTSGFTDVGQARAFCDRVHAKGGGCSIVAF